MYCYRTDAAAASRSHKYLSLVFLGFTTSNPELIYYTCGILNPSESFTDRRHSQIILIMLHTYFLHYNPSKLSTRNLQFWTCFLKSKQNFIFSAVIFVVYSCNTCRLGYVFISFFREGCHANIFVCLEPRHFKTKESARPNPCGAQKNMGDGTSKAAWTCRKST